jgi:protein phosphatase
MFLYRNGLIDVLTPIGYPHDERKVTALGFMRLGLKPDIVTENFLPGDILVIVSDGVSNFVSEEEIRLICDMAGNTQESMAHAVMYLLQKADENGSDDNMTAVLIKKKDAVEI